MNYLKAVIAILFSICKEFEGGLGRKGTHQCQTLLVVSIKLLRQIGFAPNSC